MNTLFPAGARPSNVSHRSTKIGKDPRNTYWSKDTSRFGHTYLANLGWTPGENLGDTTSSYHSSGHITDASSTGVKIVLKDDNLGIGAKKGAQHDECTGLLGLQGLLGRLNGDTKMIEQVKNEEERQKNDWIASKWGMKFVRGEIWVADDLTTLRKKLDEGRAEKAAELKAKEEAEKPAAMEESGKTKKRKRSEDKKASKKTSSSDMKSSSSSGESTSASTSKSTSAAPSEDESESQARRRKRKEEKEAKKERKEKRAEKRSEKEQRKGKRAEKRLKQKKRKAGEDVSSDSSSDSESDATPSRSVTAASAMNGRHALRARFIAAKRSAMLDQASLNEVYSITSIDSRLAHG